MSATSGVSREEASPGLNRVALVTGSTSGIGLATALVMAKRGCHVILMGLGEPEVIDNIKQRISRYGVEVDYIGGDLTDVSQLDTACKNVLDLCKDGVDILVNCAGFNRVVHVQDYSTEDYNAMVAIHMTAPFYLIRALLPTMKKKGWGRIVNMCSQLCFISEPGKAVYSAVKAGLLGLTKGVALEVAADGITCNAVCPSYVFTPLMQSQVQARADREGISLEAAKKAMASNIPIQKWMEPEQVAELVEFLCFSGASTNITGAAYLIDSGNTAQ